MVIPFMAVLLVIFLAYWVTKIIAVKYVKISSGRYMRVLDRVSLGQDRYLALVSVNGRVYVLGITGKSISKLCEFNQEELPQEEALPNKDFASFFTQSLSKYTGFHLPGSKKDR